MIFYRIASIVYERFYLSVFLFFAIALVAILQGLALSIIGPLVSLASNSDENGKLNELVFSLFEYAGIEVSILNVLCVALVIALCSAIVTVFSVYLRKIVQVDYEIEQKRKLYNLLGRVKTEFHHKMDFGFVTQVVQQETRMSSMLIEYFVRLLSFLFQGVIYFCILLMISSSMTLFVLGALFVVWLSIRKLYGVARRHGKRLGEYNDDLQANFNVMLFGYRALRTFVGYRKLIQLQEGLLQRYRHRNVELAISESALSSIFQPLALVVIILGFSIYSYSVAELFVFTAAIVKLYGCVQEMQNVYYKTSKNFASLERIESLESMLIRHEESLGRDKKPPVQIRNIELRGVDYSYDEEKRALKNISLEIEVGTKVALVGESGSGKSTLVNLLLGLYKPTTGQVLTGGNLLSDITVDSWLAEIGYVSQDVFMLNGTIRENICFYREFSDEEVVESLRLSNANEFVAKLPNGIDTRIGEGGANLSGGQRQRISLARAMISKPQVLILDEATSALDNVSERLVKDAIENLPYDVTLIVVAHRLSTVVDMDRIFLFENGELVEQGCFDEMKVRGGAFSRLLDAGRQ